MKRLSSMLLVVLFAASLMQLYRVYVELQCTCEVLAFQVNGKSEQLKALVATNFKRTRQDTQKIAELEAKLTA
ncbi:MAG TPA: hypothetical protein VMB80_10720, partial [Candidatus Acidoferrum sp.]|nr:hypothetical protein [Candidatus Acidoferrum sp.]